MNDEQIIEVITRMFREVFDDESMVITGSTSQEDIEEWDSLSHLRIILLLEKEFGIKFDIDRVGSLTSVGSIVQEVRNLVRR
ncbi:MAG: acyl carrier protein [Acetivibrionales bacterium]|jgi:acyl carrier protein